MASRVSLQFLQEVCNNLRELMILAPRPSYHIVFWWKLRLKLSAQLLGVVLDGSLGKQAMLSADRMLQHRA
jgi:hypothetical protein